MNRIHCSTNRPNTTVRILASNALWLLLMVASMPDAAPAQTQQQQAVTCQTLLQSYQMEMQLRHSLTTRMAIRDRIRRECPAQLASTFTRETPPDLGPTTRAGSEPVYIACGDGGLVLTATGSGGNGTTVELRPRELGNQAQLWHAEGIGTFTSQIRIDEGAGDQAVRFRNAKYGRYLDADMSGRHVNGKPVLLWDKAELGPLTAGEQQVWVIRKSDQSSVTIRNQINLGLTARERYLDADAGRVRDAGCKVQIWDGTSGKNQRWQLLPQVDLWGPEQEAAKGGTALQAKQMSNRAVVALKASNGKFVCADAGQGTRMVADRDAAGPWEMFWLIEVGMNEFAIYSQLGSFVCADRNQGGRLIADRFAVGDWEKFTYEPAGEGKCRLKASNGKYVCADQSKGNLLVADRDQPGEWETFTIVQR